VIPISVPGTVLLSECTVRYSVMMSKSLRAFHIGGHPAGACPEVMLIANDCIRVYCRPGTQRQRPERLSGFAMVHADDTTWLLMKSAYAVS
jgi:hypothetical protein